jgi:hypothetical protein
MFYFFELELNKNSAMGRINLGRVEDSKFILGCYTFKTIRY